MRPDWNDAPSWAEFHAFDNDGDGFWFDRLPKYDGRAWFIEVGHCSRNFSFLDAADSLEQRPCSSN